MFLLTAVAASPSLRNASKDLNLFQRPDNYKCMSIYGLETNLRNTVCSWAHPATYYMDKLKELGFNTIRLPFSMQYVVEGNYAIMDAIIKHADELGMYVIMDIHRVGNSRQEESPDKGISEYAGLANRDDFINNVIKIMARYQNNKSVTGLNSWNEASLQFLPFIKVYIRILK